MQVVGEAHGELPAEDVRESKGLVGHDHAAVVLLVHHDHLVARRGVAPAEHLRQVAPAGEGREDLGALAVRADVQRLDPSPGQQRHNADAHARQVGDLPGDGACPPHHC